MKRFYSALCLTGILAPAFAQEKPNILIIQCDHLTQRVVGAYGETRGVTPTIDRIAAQGVVFTNAYIGCPLSQPSRAGLWTGLMPHQTNVRSNSDIPFNKTIPDHIPTLGDLFTKAGYQAVHFGKTHDMGALRGFSHKEPTAKPFNDPNFPVNQDSFLDVGTCEDVTDFLSKPHDQPFICIADFQNPHNICGFIGALTNGQAPDIDTTQLPGLPANFEVQDWSKIPTPVQYICCSNRRMFQASHWSDRDYRHYIAAFQYYTRMVDKQIDQVLQALYSTPNGKNTVIVLLADHGDGMASHRLVTKHISFYDETTRIPMIVSGAGIKNQAKIKNEPLIQATTDLLPTLCDISGIAIPDCKPGISFYPLLKGEKMEKQHPFVASEWHSEYDVIYTPGRMIRSKQYKYTHYQEENGEELYDLKNDPGERINLAYDPKYKKILRQHRELLKNYTVNTNDDYYSLKANTKDCGRQHTPGYPSHTGEGGCDIQSKRK
ncbi:MAG: sulfatase-like hydrolase/transferase [Bacteroidales bacterium]